MRTLPTDPAQRSSGVYIRLVASMYLQVTSQGQPILTISLSLASEDPEANRHPMAPPFNMRLVASHLAVRFQIATWWVWVPQ